MKERHIILSPRTVVTNVGFLIFIVSNIGVLWFGGYTSIVCWIIFGVMTLGYILILFIEPMYILIDKDAITFTYFPCKKVVLKWRDIRLIKKDYETGMFHNEYLFLSPYTEGDNKWTKEYGRVTRLTKS